MAWTTPITWVNGAITASQFNAQIRDNMNFLKGEVDGLALSPSLQFQHVTSGATDTMTTTFADMASFTFSLPSGWIQFELIAVGICHFDCINVSSTPDVRIVIGATGGTVSTSGAVGVSDVTLMAVHSAANLTASTLVSIEGRSTHADMGKAKIVYCTARRTL